MRCALAVLLAFLVLSRQDRKDKEKDKRVKGQSTHASWKTEARRRGMLCCWQGGPCCRLLRLIQRFT